MNDRVWLIIEMHPNGESVACEAYSNPDSAHAQLKILKSENIWKEQRIEFKVREIPLRHNSSAKYVSEL